MDVDNPAVAGQRPRLVPFAYGFRPFFFVAGLYAAIGIAAWAWVYVMGRSPLPGLPAWLWHGHEMLFGFIGAAIAGFLLTAVPSWTGSRGFAGAPLIVATLLWLAGRLVFATAAWLPLPFVAAVELLFLPAIVLLLAPPLLRERNRNTPMLLVIAVFWLTDIAFLYGLIQGDALLASAALRIGIGLVLVLITVIGGRIVPAFTASALRKRGQPVDLRSHGWLEKLVIGSMVLIVIVDAIAPLHWVAAALAAIAAVAHAWRLAGWRTLRTLDEPIVWVLHAGYAWLPIGLALKAVYLWTGAGWAAQWLHALTIGAAALMILAVTTRASLGHTGRPLTVGKPIAVAYLLLLGATVVRVFAPLVVPTHYVDTVVAAALLWIAAFGIYLVVYTPVLLLPRVDGKSG